LPGLLRVWLAGGESGVQAASPVIATSDSMVANVMLDFMRQSPVRAMPFLLRY
jgi:hypothetical protein